MHMKLHRKKIVIIGGFGWRDIGDEAMPQAVIYNLKKVISDLDIVMFSPDPEYTQQYHKERSISDINIYLNRKPWLIAKLTCPRLGIFGKIINKIYPKNLIYFTRYLYFLFFLKCYEHGTNLPIHKIGRDIINEISSADILFNNGGGNINTLLAKELYKQTLTIWAAAKLNVPIIVSGQTIGPITNKLHAYIVKKALNYADIITFRDKAVSLNRVKMIGVYKPVLKDTADDAISLPYLSNQVVQDLILENAGYRWQKISANIIVAINMNGYLKAMGKNNINEFYKEIELFTKIADKIVEKYKAKILFIPTDYNSASDDRPLLKKIQNKMKHKQKTLVIEKEYDAIQYKSLIGLANMAIGARYHFNVFATSMGVPCIGIANGIYQKTKLKGVMDLYDLPFCFIQEDMHEVEFETVWSVVEKVLQNLSNISTHLKKTTITIQKNSMITIQRAKILSGE